MQQRIPAASRTANNKTPPTCFAQARGAVAAGARQALPMRPASAAAATVLARVVLLSRLAQVSHQLCFCCLKASWAPALVAARLLAAAITILPAAAAQVDHSAVIITCVPPPPLVHVSILRPPRHLGSPPAVMLLPRRLCGLLLVLLLPLLLCGV
jgi:hypothetical protein